MTVTTRRIKNIDVSFFPAALVTCPSAFSVALRVAADMIEEQRVRELPFGPKSNVIVASYQDDVVGFLVYSEDEGMDIELAWVDPGLRQSGVFASMLDRLLARFWVLSNAYWLGVRGEVPPFLLNHLERLGFKGTPDGLRFRPYAFAATPAVSLSVLRTAGWHRASILP